MNTRANDTSGRAAGTDPLLQPLKIRHLRLRNRIMSTSHACGLEDGGMPTERYQAYHEEKARGGLALTMFGGSFNVAVDSPSIFRQLNVGVDGVIPHLQRFSERIHAQGAVHDVVIRDGTDRHAGPLCAELAADAGCRVDLYCIDGFLAAELTYSERNHFKQRCYAKGITTHVDRRLLRVQRNGNKLEASFLNDVSLTQASVLADMVVVEHGTLPADALYHELRARSVNDGVTDVDALVALQPQPRRQDGAFELHRIGGAVASRNVHAAILDAFRLCVCA